MRKVLSRVPLRGDSARFLPPLPVGSQETNGSEPVQQLWQQRLQEEKAWDGWEVDSEAYIEGFADAAALVYREVLPLL